MSPSLLLAQDEPDLKKENRFHRIYEKYNSTPTSDERWKDALGKAQDQSYVIQKGDTLWDISETFFGDPYFWPKVWSVNREIYNPHEILPKGAVQFIPGTSSEPPAMGLAKNDAATEAEKEKAKGLVPPPDEGVNLKPEIKKQVNVSVAVDLSKIKIPPSERKNLGPPANLPASIPAYIYFRDAVKDAELELSPIKYSDVNQPLYVTHFVSDSTVYGIGEVVEIESGSHGVGVGAHVLIKGDGFQPGTKLTIFKSLGSVSPPEGGGKGKVNQVEAEVVVGEPVNSRRGIYRCTVTKAVSLFQVGDDVLPEEMPVVVTTPLGNANPTNATIIGGSFAATRNYFGPYSYVFLDQGTGAGLAVGAHLPIYRNPRVHDPDSKVRENPIEIGELQIVRVGEGVATAIVLRASEEITVGDVTTPAIE